MITNHPPTGRAKKPDGRGFRSVGELVEGMGAAWSRFRPPPPTGVSCFFTSICSGISIRNGYRSEYLLSRLPGRPLADLGAGYFGNMAEFAKAYNVSVYTAVDRYWPYPRTPANGRIRMVNADMLEFLDSQPDSSSNIVMNAIDEFMLKCLDSELQREYTERLIEHIARVVPPGGIAFGFNSPCLGMLEGHSFVRMELRERKPLPDFAIFMERVD